MNHPGLEESIRTALGGTATRYAARLALDSVLRAIREGLQSDGCVKLAGFGTFRRVARRPRRLLLPRDGRAHLLPEREVIVFRESPAAKG